MRNEENRNIAVVQWFAECIFPQKLKTVVTKFSENVIIDCITDGLVQRSHSKIGANPTMLSQPNGYIELSSKGWNLYNTLTQTGSSCGCLPSPTPAPDTETIKIENDGK